MRCSQHLSRAEGALSDAGPKTTNLYLKCVGLRRELNVFLLEIDIQPYKPVTIGWFGLTNL